MSVVRGSSSYGLLAAGQRRPGSTRRAAAARPAFARQGRAGTAQRPPSRPRAPQRRRHRPGRLPGLGTDQELFADSTPRSAQPARGPDRPEKFQAAGPRPRAQVDAAKRPPSSPEGMVEKTRADLAKYPGRPSPWPRRRPPRPRSPWLDSRRTLARNTDLRKRGFIAQPTRNTRRPRMIGRRRPSRPRRRKTPGPQIPIRRSTAQGDRGHAGRRPSPSGPTGGRASAGPGRLDHTEIRAPVTASWSRLPWTSARRWPRPPGAHGLHHRPGSDPRCRWTPTWTRPTSAASGKGCTPPSR